MNCSSVKIVMKISCIQDCKKLVGESKFMKQINKWDYIELKFQAEAKVSYFTEIEFYAIFNCGGIKNKVHGFYDDEGIFILRFMPTKEGIWEYTTYSNLKVLNNITDKLECVSTRKGIHGLIKVADKWHFAFADGTPYYPFGTTAYVWNYQSEKVQAETMQTLAKAPFNKIRMCIFPKHYDYNLREPEMTPFCGNINKGFDFKHFNCRFFHRLEEQIIALQKLNIEVDLILFHPYDRWGFSKMTENVDLQYVSYVIARLSAFRNIWWSLANEYDLLKEKSNVFWDKVFYKIEQEDAYGHLRSIHNWYCPTYHYQSNAHWYDHKKDWVTHASIQCHDMHFISEWRETYNKPIMIDECRYEGNMDLGWGNLSGEKMVDLFWQAVVSGAYATHGETYMNQDEIIWWAHGGRLIGESPIRIGFLRKIMEEGPIKRLIPLVTERHWDATIGRNEDESYWLIYFGESCPKYRHLDMLPQGRKYNAEIIDVWNMIITPVKGKIYASSTIELFSKKYIAIRLTEVQ